MADDPESDNGEVRTCASCGRLLSRNDAGPVCVFCVHEAWLATNPGSTAAIRDQERRAESAARKALMAELGMPPDAQYFAMSQTHHGGEWDGFTLEMLGMEPPERVWPPPWPYLAFRDDRTQRVGILKQIWLRRVHLPDSPLIVEARWHPERDERIAIHGFEDVKSENQFKSALSGFRFLRQLDHKGRPPGRTNLSREVFLRLYPQAVADCLADGLAPTDNNLVMYLPISKATLVRYRNKWLRQD